MLVSCGASKAVKQDKDDKHGKPSDEDRLRQLFIQAASEEAQGNFDRALSLLKKCENIDAENSAVQYELSRLYAFHTEYTDAVNHGERAIELDQSNYWYKIHLADLYKKLSRFEEASELYKSIVESNPNEENLSGYATNLIHAGKYKDAINVLKRLEDKVGDDPQLTHQIYQLYMEIGDEKSAMKVLQEAAVAHPDDIMFQGLLANGYENTGDVNKTIETYEGMLKLDPQNARIHVALYELYKYKGNSSKANEHLMHVFESGEMNIDDKMQVLFDLYEETELNVSGRKEVYPLLDNLVEMHPDDPKGYSIYGDFLIRDEKEKEARDMFAKALEFEAEKFIIWNQVMYLDMQLNDYESLYKHSEEALSLFPNQPGIYYFNGLSLYKKKDYASAIDILESGKALIIDDEQLKKEFCTTLGDAYHANGDNANAYSNYDCSLAIFPDNTYVLNNYAYYLSLDGTMLDKAEAMAVKAVANAPTQSSYIDTYAWVLFKKKEYEKALNTINNAIENANGKKGVYYEHKGDILFHLDRLDEAVEMWEKAKEDEGASDLIDDKIKTKKYIE